MFKKAFNDFRILKTKSFFIGDRETDKKASEKIDLKFYWPERDFLKQIKKIVKLY